MATLIKYTGEEEEVKPAYGKKFTLEELQEYVGGYIEIIGIQKYQKVICNEDGRHLRLPVNNKASLICKQAIVGNILICELRELN